MSSSSRSPRYIVVLDPAVRRPELEAFNRMSAASAVPFHYHLPCLFGMASVHTASPSPDAIIILGSLASVNDSNDWQKEMNDWLLDQWKRDVPTLGICYGHQLVAHLHGGKVGFAFEDQTKHVGLRRIRLAPNPLWRDQALEGKVAVSHCEEVKVVPPELKVVGESPEVKVEALAHGKKPIWSFQSHPEATTSFFKNRGMHDETNGQCLHFGHSLVQAFLDYVAKRK